MTTKFLLELGIEEMPAHVVTPSINQFEQRVTDFLKENRLSFGKVEKYSTPRRLALIINDLADKQEDIDELAKGPAKKIAQDDEGNWSKAAMGFARGQGGSVEDIFFQELKGVEYAYIQKHEVGKAAEEILADIQKPLKEMVFPTRMHWGKTRFEYIRPIHWLIAMLDDKIVDAKILDIQAGNKTRGHRFLGHEGLEISNASSYVETLKNDFVFVDADERKSIIRNQIENIGKENHWDIDIDEDLLEEVNNLVEYPTAFYGKFDRKYLSIPDEVLITSMKDNQRYFYARTADGKLAPIFIGVRNGNTEYIENVIAGNEKVLVARLEDAKFFFEEDQKHDISFYVNRLKDVTFQVKIGSVYEKMKRTAIIAKIIGQKVGLSDTELADLATAASMYKFDLVTNMVDEFPELQGIMGNKYARIMGENSAVSEAIEEHYMPTTAEGELPATKVGSVLAIADKLDSIMSFFAVDIIPSGSNDPFALRRQAYGIDRILLEKDWNLSFNELQTIINENIHNDVDYSKHANEVTEFIIERLRQIFKNSKMDHDIVETTLKSSSINPLTIIEAADVLKAKKDTDNYKKVIEAIVRINKLATKVDFEDVKVSEELLQNDAEKILLHEYNKAASDFSKMSMLEVYNSLEEMKPSIDKYFEENMIMDKNENIKHNRLSQLKLISDMYSVLGDLNELIIK